MYLQHKQTAYSFYKSAESIGLMVILDFILMQLPALVHLQALCWHFWSCFHQVGGIVCAQTSQCSRATKQVKVAKFHREKLCVKYFGIDV